MAKDNITIDGHEMKAGEKFYSIGVTKLGNYKPGMGTYPRDWYTLGNEKYFDINECEKACNLKNMIND